MSFGFSAGDFVASLLLVKDVVKALNASTCSIAEVKALLTTLESLQNDLLSRSVLCGPAILNDGTDPVTQTITPFIEAEWKECSGILDKFMKSLKPYQDAFCNNQGSTLARQARKLTWLLRKDDVLEIDRNLTRHLTVLEMFCGMISHLHTKSIVQTSATIQSIVLDIRASVTSISQAIQPVKSIPPTLGYPWEGSSSLSDHVTLLDAIGRTVILPIVLVSSPEDIHKLLVIMYRDIPGRNKILKQEYAFTDEEYEGIILEGYNWATRIRAGMKLSLNIIFHAAQSFDLHRCPRCEVVCSGNRLPGRRRRCQAFQLTFRIIDKIRPIQEITDASSGEVSKQKVNDSSEPPCADSKSSLAARGREVEPLFKNIHYHREIPGVQSSPETSIKQLLINDLPPLHRAAALGNISAIRRLLDGGSEIDLPVPFNAVLASPSCSSDHWSPQKFEGCTSLHIACWFGKLDAITALLDRGASVLAQAHPHGYQVVTFAIQGHNPEQVFYPLLERGARVQYQDVDGGNPLIIASATGKSFMIHELLRRDALIDLCDKHGISPLQTAAYSGHESAFDALLSHGATLTPKNILDCQTSTLHQAAQGGSLKIIMCLLDHGQDPNILDEHDQLPLSISSRYGHLEASKLLFAHTFEIHQNPSLASDALRWASFAGLDRIVSMLLDLGADCNLKDHFEQSSLHYACGRLWGKCSRATESTVRLLLEAGACMEHSGWEGGTPLLYAAGNGLLKIVKLLLQHGANVDARQDDGSSPLNCALGWGNFEVADMLFKHANVNVKVVNNDSTTALHFASSSGHVPTVRLLLELGLDIEAVHTLGRTALHTAARWPMYNSAGCLHILLQNGANINTTAPAGCKALYSWDEYIFEVAGCTPLICASEQGYLAAVEILLNAGADITASRVDGKNALSCAVRSGNAEIVALLLEKGIDRELPDLTGRTPLIEDSRLGKVDIVKLLLKHGAAIDSRDHEGRTALHWACFGGFETIAKALTEGGAAIFADSFGRTPLHDAGYNGSEAVVKLLLDNGADPHVKLLAGTTLDAWSR